MNILRVVPRTEDPKWVQRLFQPPTSDQPDILTYPLSCYLGQAVERRFLYVAYQGEVVGYARIARVEAHRGETIGSTGEAIAVGDSLILEAPLTRMPFRLTCGPIRRFKYIGQDLHRLTQPDAQAALDG